MRTTLWLNSSVSQTLPSGPATMPLGPPATLSSSMTWVVGVKRPTLFAARSVNQMLPSGPAVILTRPAFGVGTGYSLTWPPGVIRPIMFADASTNQT